MSSVRIQTSAVEPIEALILDAALDPLTGKTDILLSVRRKSDGWWLDWADMTFKSAGWTTRQQAMTELDSTNAPGEYGYNLSTGTITNPATDDTYEVRVDQSPGTDAANVPQVGEIKVGQYVDDIDAAVSSRAVPGDEMNLANDAITSAKYDEATAYPLAQADTGASAVARTGADADTLETLSDQLDAKAEPGDAMDLIADALDAAALAADAINEIRDAILADSTPFNGADIDAAISSRSSHTAAQAATEVWNEALPGAFGAGTAGYILGTNLDALISSRAAPGAAMGLVTDALDEDALATSALAELNTYLETTAGHGAGSWQSATVSPSAVATAVWSEALPGAFGAGSAGYILGTNLDVPVSDLPDEVWEVDPAGHIDDDTYGQLLGQLPWANAVYLDKTNGTPGTGANIGTRNNPVNNEADAITISAAKGVRRWIMLDDQTYTLTQAFTDWRFESESGSVVNLNGQTLTGTTFFHCVIVGAGEPVACWECAIFSATITSTFYRCLIGGGITLSASGCNFIQCAFDGASINTGGSSADFQNGSGRLYLQGVSGGTVRLHDFNGELILENSCIGGTIYLSGEMDLTDNSAGANVVPLTALLNTGTVHEPIIAARTTAQAGSTATSILTSLSQVDGFYDGMQVMVINAAGVVTRNIDNYNQVDGEIEVEALPFTPSVGDTVLVLSRMGAVAIDEASLVNAVWSEALPGGFGVGQAGYLLGTNLDDQITDIMAAIGALNDIDQAGVQAALTTQGYTVGRSLNLDNLDAPITSRSSHTAIDVDTQLSGAHGAGSWEGDSAATIDALLSTNHGAGSWEGTTPAAIDALLTASHGTGLWTAAPVDPAVLAQRFWQEPFAGYNDDTQFGYIVHKYLRALVLGDAQQDQVNKQWVVYDPDDGLDAGATELARHATLDINDNPTNIHVYTRKLVP